MFKTPILFIAFNRLDTASKVFEVIAKQKPEKLFFAVDAPRNEAEQEKCNLVKSLVKNISWQCDIKTFFPERNLGPRLAVSSAVTWFFNQVESGIILEHDCLPDESFFRFCEELLIFYKDSPKIMHITGNNFAVHKDLNDGYSYFFSSIPSIWGWATLRLAWKNYD